MIKLSLASAAPKVGFFERAVYLEDSIKLCGWAKHPFENKPADSVIIVDDKDQVYAKVSPSIEREDVKLSFKEPDLLHSGWEVHIKPEDIADIVNLHAFVECDGKRYRMQGSITVKKQKPNMFIGYDLYTLIKRGLKVGRNFTLQPDCYIDYSHCWLISIGDNVTFAPRVHVIAHDGSMRKFTGHIKVGVVEIGNKVFVGNDSMILPGVKIGDNVIIGAGSVVTKDVPSGCVYAGNPAKYICKTEEYLAKINDQMDKFPVFGKEYTLERGITDEQKEEMKIRLKKAGGIGFI